MRFINTLAGIAGAATLGLGLMVTQAPAADTALLKFAYWLPGESKDWTETWEVWMNKVVADADGTLEIKPFVGGSLGRDPASQLKMLEDGVADIVYPVPAYTPGRFPDTEFTELSGLFRTGQEAASVTWKVYERGLIKGYEDIKLIGTLASTPFTFHTRKPVGSLDDLKGMKIRAAGKNAIAALEKLEVSAVGMNMAEMTEALSRGVIDGVAQQSSVINQMHADEVAKHHYMLPMWTGFVFMGMRQDTFDKLPDAAKASIEKNSGFVISDSWGRQQDEFGDESIAGWSMEGSGHTVVRPTEEDLAKSEEAFQEVIDQWVGDDPHREEIMAAVREEIAAYRAGQ